MIYLGIICLILYTRLIVVIIYFYFMSVIIVYLYFIFGALLLYIFYVLGILLCAFFILYFDQDRLQPITITQVPQNEAKTVTFGFSAQPEEGGVGSAVLFLWVLRGLGEGGDGLTQYEYLPNCHLPVIKVTTHFTSPKRRNAGTGAWLVRSSLTRKCKHTGSVRMFMTITQVADVMTAFQMPGFVISACSLLWPIRLCGCQIGIQCMNQVIRLKSMNKSINGRKKEQKEKRLCTIQLKK